MSSYTGLEPKYGVFEQQLLPTDGVNSEFLLLYQIGYPGSIIVISDGLVQEPNLSYTLTEGGRKIVFSYVPLVTERLIVLFLGRELSIPAVAGAYPLRIRLESPTLNNVSTNIDLSSFIPSDLGILREESTIVFKNGVGLKFGIDWKYDVLPDFKIGTTIVFTSAPLITDKIDIYIHGVERTNISTVDPKSITGDKLIDKISIGGPTNKCEDIWVKNLHTDTVLSNYNTESIEIKSHAGFNGSESYIITNAITTTTSAATLLFDLNLTPTLPLLANGMFWFECDICGLNETLFSGLVPEDVWVHLKGGVKLKSGVASIIGLVENASGTNNSGYGAYATVFGSNLQILVNGHPSNNVHWAATLKYQGIIKP